MKQKTLWIIIVASHLTNGCDEIPDASECNHRGTLMCGQCHCYSPYFGHHCELDASVAFASDEGCKESPDGPICSGRGQCISGYCECNMQPNPHEIVSGQFCECTNFLCESYNGLLCSGPDHGECTCNKCRCNPGWDGPACSCEDSVKNCISPVNGEICSGNGICDCNNCRCYERYSGIFCESCPTCQSHCVDVKDCVYCHSFGGRSCRLSNQELQDCNVNIQMVSSLEGTEDRRCRFFDDDGCSYNFAYRFSRHGVDATVENRMSCPPPSRISDNFMVAEGRHYCMKDFDFVLSSELTTKTNISWTFEPRFDERIDIFCPYINIPPSQNCDDNMLLISEEEGHSHTERICRDTRNYRFSSDKSVKISFWKSVSSAEFACKLSCVDLYLSTTPPPKYQCPAGPPKTPIVVATCADFDEEFSGPCQCYDCGDGHISLHCAVCEDCDLNPFASFDFRTDIELEVKLTCNRQLNLSGFFRHNSDKIKYIKICVEDDIVFPYAEFINLEALAFQDCHLAKFGICQIKVSTTESLKLTSATSRVPGMEASPKDRTFTGTKMQLPVAKEVPRLVQLSMTNVNLTLSQGLLDFPLLRELLIDSRDVSVETNAFANLDKLQFLVWNSCQVTLGSQFFRLTTRNLKYLTIQNDCLQSLAPDAIIIDSTDEDGHARADSDELKVAVRVKETFFDHIPMCPFRTLLDLTFVRITWLSGLNCRSCGGIWHWELTKAQSDRLEALCTDPVSGLKLPIRNYTASNQKICTFLTGYPDSCS